MYIVHKYMYITHMPIIKLYTYSGGDSIKKQLKNYKLM